MGLSSWLAKSRMQYQGYDPAWVEAQQSFLAKKQADEAALAEHRRLQEERQFAVAERAAQADIDRANEAAEKKRADALAAVEKQLDLGVPPAQLMRSPGVSDDDVTAAVERVYFRKQRAQEDKDTATDQAADAKFDSEERAAARQLERDQRRDAAAETREEKRRLAQEERDRNKPKPDPILDRATKLVQASEAALSMSPDQIDEEARKLADRMRQRGGATAIADPATSAVAKAATAGPAAPPPDWQVPIMGGTKKVAFSSLPPDKQAAALRAWQAGAR